MSIRPVVTPTCQNRIVVDFSRGVWHEVSLVCTETELDSVAGKRIEAPLPQLTDAGPTALSGNFRAGLGNYHLVTADSIIHAKIVKAEHRRIDQDGK